VLVCLGRKKEKKMYVLRVSGFHLDAASRARHDRARHVLSTLGVAYTECTVNKACAPFPDGNELPQLCTQDERGALTVIGGIDAIDELNDSGLLRSDSMRDSIKESMKAECEAFKNERRLEYAARASASSVHKENANETDQKKRELALEETVRQLRAKIETLERAVAEAVRAAEHSNAEMEAMERNAARLERKLAHASRALESASGLFSTLVAFAHTAEQ
jgi:hypothetical protein